jgi:hypothetical protein
LLIVGTAVYVFSLGLIVIGVWLPVPLEISLNSVYYVSFWFAIIVPIVPVKNPRLPVNLVPKLNLPGSIRSHVLFINELLLEIVVLPVILRLFVWILGGFKRRLIYPFPLEYIISSLTGRSRRLILESSNLLLTWLSLWWDTMHVVHLTVLSGSSCSSN